MRLLLALLLYFALISSTLALLFLPGARGWALHHAARLRATGRAASRSVSRHAGRGLAQVSRGASHSTRRAHRWTTRHARWIALALAVLVLPPLLAFAWRTLDPLSTYDHTVSHEVNEQVAALLKGEQLVPPAALPPELFMTREVEEARPATRDGDRRWELLDAEFRKRLLVVYKIMLEQHGYEMVLLEGYRTPARQARLAELGPQVTRAGPFESYHQHGLAADNAFMRDGRVVISERDPWAMRGYELYGEVARSAGLAWGGGWSMKDYGHVELRRPGALGTN